MSWNIFNLLGINSKLSKNEKLTKFKEMKCFYTEVVKCRIEKFDGKTLVNRTIKNCSDFLKEEIKSLNPSAIAVMGKQALYSLSICEPFNDSLTILNLNTLMKQSIVKPILIRNTRLYFFPLPIWRNLRHLVDILTLFNQIRKELG